MPMIESIYFKNFKALRDAEVTFSPFTLLVGANGSGKSTVLRALGAAAHPTSITREHSLSAGARPSDLMKIELRWAEPYRGAATRAKWPTKTPGSAEWVSLTQDPLSDSVGQRLPAVLAGHRVFAFHPDAIAAPVLLQKGIELAPSGAGLAGVLDRIRDEHPERFEDLKRDLARWIPEFDQILFEVPGEGSRSFALRTKEGHHAIRATDLSHGTLLALALLTLTYVPNMPGIICLEEPDRGIHPRLLRDVKDAIYRLCYPDASARGREPIQVIATSHSPYFLDLFKDHPEEVVLAHKVGLDARFVQLSDRPDLAELLQDASLGEIWYSGILGGVPAR